MRQDWEVFIVAGLGRCGSSLVMQMLHAAGVPTVGEWPDFEDRVQPLCSVEPDTWLQASNGKATKALSPHVWPLPKGPAYRGIWLSRDYQEQAKSTLKLFAKPSSRRGIRELASQLRREAAAARRSLIESGMKDFATLTFEEIIRTPHRAASTLVAALGLPEPDRNEICQRMVRAVRPRQPECLPYLLELELIGEIAA